MPTVDYHLEELKIARNPNDPRHSLPTFPSDLDNILDVGCGIGQIFLASPISNVEIFQCGVDRDLGALMQGNDLADHICFVCATGENLPFSDNSFDMVLCRAGLPYMNNRVALESFFSVLRPKGYLWLTLHNYQSVMRFLLEKLSKREYRSACFFLYALFSGITLHLWGINYSIPFSNGRYSSFQTIKSITRTLREIGFERISHTNRRSNIVVARKF